MDLYSKMKLYNLIYEDKYFVSCIPPSKLPEKNFCFVEIEYNGKGIVTIVKGILVEDDRDERKESVLSDLDIDIYVEKLKEFLKRQEIDKDKIHLNFVENIDNEEERILKIFIILISSYLVFFNFMQLPYNISLDLLNNEKFQYFTAFSSVNAIEEVFLHQVSLLHRYFSDIFKNEKNGGEDLIEQIKEYKRRLFLDIDKKLQRFDEKFEEVEELQNKLSKIFKDF